MLSMNGIIVCELILGAVLMSLIFTSLANADLIADSSLKSKHEPKSDTVKIATKPGRALTDLSPGDRIEAMVNQENHALSIRGTDASH